MNLLSLLQICINPGSKYVFVVGKNNISFLNPLLLSSGPTDPGRGTLQAGLRVQPSPLHVPRVREDH